MPSSDPASMLGTSHNAHRHQYGYNELVERRKDIRDPRYIAYEDKLLARNFAERLGCPVPALYHATRDPRTIPFDTLPSSYVIKTNHLSGSQGLHMIHDGVDIVEGIRFTPEQLVERTARALRQRHLRDEWAVYQIEPTVLVEELIAPDSAHLGEVCTSYHCHVFGGRVEILMHVPYSCKRYRKRTHLDTIHTYYDRHWTRLDFISPTRTSVETVERPQHLERMIGCAEMLGQGIDYLRADFYSTPEHPVFAEFSLFPGAGHQPLTRRGDRHLAEFWTQALLKGSDPQMPADWANERNPLAICLRRHLLHRQRRVVGMLKNWWNEQRFTAKTLYTTAPPPRVEGDTKTT